MYVKQANRANYGALRSVNDLYKNGYIVIHYTANNGDTARGNCEYFAREVLKNPASAHYFVDEKEVASSVPENYTAFHCGTSRYGGYRHFYCRNHNSIGIELCSRKDEKGRFYFESKTVENAAQLVADKIELYNIPLSHVIRHYDVTGKQCPEPFVRSAKEWAKFKDRIQEILEERAMRYYETLQEIPAGEMREVVQKLIDKKAIRGNSGGLHLSEDTVRLLVFLTRYGVL